MICTWLLAAVSVLPIDRLAMADRLFNRGDYAAAQSEYAALEGEKSLPADDLQYRLAECLRAQGKTKEANDRYARIVSSSPDSRHFNRARLMLALSAVGGERQRQLAVLDSDRVEAAVRASALYHLGIEKGDAALLERCAALDPKGCYAPYARLRRCALLTDSSDAATRRRGVEGLLEIAFANSPLADEALYLAAAVSYREKKYGEAGSLFRRYRKMFPRASHAEEARVMSVWCDYVEGRYADAEAALGETAGDDFDYLRAACRLARGKNEESVALFKAYLDRYPKGRYRKEAGLQLARAEFTRASESENRDQMVEAARRAARASGDPTDAVRLAWAYAKAGRHKEAEAEYERISKAFPRSEAAAQALYARGSAAIRAEDWRKGEIFFSEALATRKLGDLTAQAKYWRGVAMLRLGHFAEAVRLLKEALADGLPLDENREARLMVAETDLQEGRTEEAKKAYRQLVAEGACERMSAARIFSVARLVGGETAETCGRALMKSPTAEWRQVGYALAGEACEAKGAVTEAINAYRKGLDEKVKTSEAPRLALALGRLEVRQGDFAAAESTLKTAVELNTGNVAARAEAYLLLAERAEAVGDAKAARGYATLVVTLFEDSSSCAAAKKVLDRLGKETK